MTIEYFCSSKTWKFTDFRCSVTKSLHTSTQYEEAEGNKSDVYHTETVQPQAESSICSNEQVVRSRVHILKANETVRAQSAH
jgi:hypothetical protein